MAILETHDIGKALWAADLGAASRRSRGARRQASPRSSARNGSGKSTLLKAWVGFEPPTEGYLTVDGIDPWKDRAGAIARIGSRAPGSPRCTASADGR